MPQILDLPVNFRLSPDRPEPISNFEGNQGCIKLSQTAKVNPQSKLIDVKIHLKYIQISAKEMTADILMKPLDSPLDSSSKIRFF